MCTKLIVVSFNERCRVAEHDDFHMLLSTVQNLLSDKSSDAAEEAVASLPQAAADGVGSAAAVADAVARGALEVALGADVAPPAATSDAEGHADDYCG